MYCFCAAWSPQGLFRFRMSAARVDPTEDGLVVCMKSVQGSEAVASVVVLLGIAVEPALRGGALSPVLRAARLVSGGFARGVAGGPSPIVLALIARNCWLERVRDDAVSDDHGW